MKTVDLFIWAAMISAIVAGFNANRTTEILLWLTVCVYKFGLFGKTKDSS